MDRKDCFARYQSPNGEAGCSALNEKNCLNCNFYRNDLRRDEIEKDIEKYSSIKGIKRNEH